MSQIEGGQEKNQYFACPVVYTDNKWSNRRCQDQLANVERDREKNETRIKNAGNELGKESGPHSLLPLPFVFPFFFSCELQRVLQFALLFPDNLLTLIHQLPEILLASPTVIRSWFHIHISGPHPFISYCIVRIYYFLHKLKESGKEKKREKKGVGMRFVAVVIPAALVPPAIRP